MVVPSFQLHDNIDTFMVTHAHSTIQVGNIDDTDTPDFHVVAGQFGAKAFKIAPFAFSHLDDIIGDQAMAPFDQTKSRLTFSYRGVALDQYSYPKDLYQRSVSVHAWGEFFREKQS